MLESTRTLTSSSTQGSPTKHPAVRLRDDRGGRRAADPVHERDPGRDRRDRGRAGRRARGAGRVARAPRAHPGGDPPELRPAPELLRPRGGRDRGRGGAERSVVERRATQRRATSRCRPGPREITLDDMKRLVARDAPPDARRRHPDPAEPQRLVGRPGRRGRDRPRRPVGQRRPHLARARLPEPAPGPQAARAARLRAHRAPLRVPAVPRSRVDGAGRARRGQAQVLELHPAARARAAAPSAQIDPELAPRAIERGRAGERAHRGRADGAVRRDAARR